jgi:hypothetical protein
VSRVMHLPGDTKGACICVPSYGGMSPTFVYSLASSVRELGTGVGLMILQGDCHVDDARNYMAQKVMDEGYESLIFIDADTVWRPSGLRHLMEHNRDVVGGVQPLKQDLEEYRCRHLPGPLQADEDGLLEVETCATAFLKISTHALKTLAATSVWVRHQNEDFPLIFERTVRDGVRFSGDYSFCLKWREAGGKVFIDPMTRLGHCGEKEWEGCYGAWLKKVNGLPLDGIERVKLGQFDVETMHGLFQDWGNKWAARPELLYACAVSAQSATGPIIEYGSGLTTLVMAAANPHVQVHAVEHDPAYLNQTHAAAVKSGLSNVNLWLAPMAADGTYDLSNTLLPKPELVVLDGPPRYLGGNRALMLEKLNGSAVLIDDVKGDMAEKLAAWAQAHGRDYRILGEFAAVSPLH